VDGRVIAHCLNFDLVTAAPEINEAANRLDMLVSLYVERAIQCGNYSALNTAAPEHYWEQFSECFRAGRVFKSQRHSLQIRVPDVLPMEQPYSTIAVLAATAAAAA
jgi:hypothetical protein